MPMTPEFVETIMNMSDEKLENLFADMGIEINLNATPNMMFEDVEQELIDNEFIGE